MGWKLRKVQFKKLLWLLLMGVLGFVVAFFLFSPRVVRQFQLAVNESAGNTVVLDVHGNSVAVVEGLEDRQWVPLSRVSPWVQKAVVAIEDQRFFYHYGIDPRRVFGALFSNLRTVSYGQGASTITQQLVKLTLLSSERKLSRKLKEIWMALAVERTYSKTELLGFYLNRVYFGNGLYGIEQASRVYFHRTAEELDLQQAVFLAALVKKPEGYLRSLQHDTASTLDFEQLTDLKKRYQNTLQAMFDLNWIDEASYEEAFNNTPQVYRPYTKSSQASYFVDEIKKEARRLLKEQRISGRGWKIYTGLDLRMQYAAERAVENWAVKNPNQIQLGLLAMDVQSGFVRAMIGGRDYAKSQFNRTTQARRQTGSVFKPFLYATAFTEGLYPHSLFEDRPFAYYWNKNVKARIKQPVSINPYEPSEDYPDPKDQKENLRAYTPRNNQHRYGLLRFSEKEKKKEKKLNLNMTLSRALQISSNVIAVQLLSQIGNRPLERMSRRFGMELRHGKGLCVALGCSETTLENIIPAFAVFANQGRYQPTRYIQRIVNNQGDELYKYTPKAPKRVISTWTAFQIRHILQGVLTHGTGWRARLKGTPAAGKTGTSDNARDVWFIGFTSQIAAGIWMGNDNNYPLIYKSGGQDPAIIWKEFMQAVVNREPPKAFSSPNQAFHSKILCDLDTKKIYSNCPASNVYYFRPSDPLPDSLSK